jgi:trehalose 6-phosphate synthase/phosphatase
MARLVLVSNRMPVTVRSDRRELAITPSAGGLATGLKGAHAREGSLWIGWPGDVSRLGEEQRRELDRRLRELRFVPVHLSPAEISRFYEGFSNGVLWPLFHYLLEDVPFDSRDWKSYQGANERFADAVARHHEPGDIVWIQDYQLTLVPELLRRRIPDARIGFFLHIPFPSSEVFRILPWRESILEGMLGADLIGFHTYSYARHFLTSLRRLLGLEPDVDTVRYRGRLVHLGVFPMGIDALAFESLASSPEVSEQVASILRQAAGEQILLAVDRLDYTKGILRRLLAFERLLERERSLRGRVRLVQVAVPSRTRVNAYALFRRQVDEMIGRINGALGGVGWVPVHYLYRAISERQLAALYRSANVMMVTPLRDGMNLVAKEFVATRSDEDGVLVLSEFAGAATELGEALHVNPYDIDRMATVMRQALTMPKAERTARMRGLRRRVLSNDVHRWVGAFLQTLEQQTAAFSAGQQRFSSPEEIEELTHRLREAERLLLLLDYDGTLVSFSSAPELAAPDAELRELLRALSARRGTLVHVVSGRTRESVDRWLGDLPIGLHAEHGFASRMGSGRQWTTVGEVSLAWKEKAQPILEQFVASTPGALIEDKTAGIAWHYRMADPEFGELQAKELRLLLGELLQNAPVEILLGDRVVELRVQGIHKGRVLGSILVENPGPIWILAMGDDRTDQELFSSLPPQSDIVQVGRGPTLAPYRLVSPAEARALLGGLLG